MRPWKPCPSALRNEDQGPEAWPGPQLVPRDGLFAGPLAHRRQPAALRKACQQSPRTQTPLLHRPPTLPAPASLQLSGHLHLPARTAPPLETKPRSLLWCVPVSRPEHGACCGSRLPSFHLGCLKRVVKRVVDQESRVGIEATVLIDAGHSRLRGAACRAASAGKRPRKAGACAAAGHRATGDQRRPIFDSLATTCDTSHLMVCWAGTKVAGFGLCPQAAGRRAGAAIKAGREPVVHSRQRRALLRATQRSAALVRQIRTAAIVNLLAIGEVARPEQPDDCVEMRAESGVDMTAKEQYLSPEEFQKAGPW